MLRAIPALRLLNLRIIELLSKALVFLRQYFLPPHFWRFNLTLHVREVDLLAIYQHSLLRWMLHCDERPRISLVWSLESLLVTKCVTLYYDVSFIV